MALYWIEGFEASQHEASLERTYTEIVSTFSARCTYETGRVRGKCIASDGGGIGTAFTFRVDLFEYAQAATPEGVTLGWGMKWVASPAFSEEAKLFTFREEAGADNLSEVFVVPSTATGGLACLAFRRPDTGQTLLVTDEFDPEDWGYFEVQVFFSATVGTIAAFRNGYEIGSIDTVNTDPPVSLEIDSLYVHMNPGVDHQVFLDDIYLSGGATPPDRTGDVVIEAMLPVADDADDHDFTPSTGTDHYAMVDDAPTAVTPWADYNSAPWTIPAEDGFEMSNPRNLESDIKGVQFQNFAENNTGALRSISAGRKTEGNYEDVHMQIADGATKDLPRVRGDIEDTRGRNPVPYPDRPFEADDLRDSIGYKIDP